MRKATATWLTLVLSGLACVGVGNAGCLTDGGEPQDYEAKGSISSAVVGSCGTRVAIDRYYSSTYAKHVYAKTTESPPSGYVREDAGRFCLDAADSGVTQPLYRCTRTNPARDSLSLTTGCSGGIQATIGYVRSTSSSDTSALNSLSKSTGSPALTDYWYAPTSTDTTLAQSLGYSGSSNLKYVWLPDSSSDGGTSDSGGGGGGGSGNGSKTGAKRAFALDDGVTHADVDGLAIRLAWDNIEGQANNNYVWTQLNQKLDQVKNANKKATLHIMPVLGGASAPAWLLSLANMTKYTYTFNGISHTDPIPWNSVYQSQWFELLDALYTNLNNNNYLSYVENMTVAFPVPEMNLVGCSNGNMGTSTVPAGISYDRAAYLQMWKDTIAKYNTKFPTVNKFLSAPQGNICTNVSDSTFFSELMTYALGLSSTKFYAFAADLRDNGSARVAMDAYTNIAFQPVAAITNDPNNWINGGALPVYCSGREWGGDYFEVYSVDLNSTDQEVKNGIKSIHSESYCP